MKLEITTNPTQKDAETLSKGIIDFNNLKIPKLEPIEDEVKFSVFVKDKTGNIWFSSFSHGGVTKYDGIALTHYAIEDGLSDDMISTSYIDRSGNLWFGTRAGGMNRFDGETFKLEYYEQKD